MTQASATPAQPVSLGLLLRLAIWFGVLAGVVELLLLGYDKFVAAKLLFTSRDVFWMAPLAYVLYCLVVGLVVFALSGGKPKLTAVTGAFIAMAVGGWCFMFASLYWVAVLVIAIGAGLKLSQVIGAKAAGFERLVNKTFPLVVVLWVGLLGGTTAWCSMSRSGPSGVAPANAPNVVLITLDTVRSKSLGLYGYGRDTTPQLEKLAAKSVVFDRAIATAPWTLPSHVSMLTGRFHYEVSANWTTGLDAEHATLAEVLGENGYATAGFASNLNYTAYEVGLDRGFGHYEDYPVSLGQIVLCSSLGRAVSNMSMLREMLGYHEQLNRKMAKDVSAEFLSWVDGHGDAPFFAFLNYYDAHQPYLPSVEFEGKFGKVMPRKGFRYDTNLIEIEHWTELPAEQIQMENDAYDAAIAWLDDELGKLFDALEQRGKMENTVIIVASDHGEQFGEHELYNHGNSLYMQNTHVPLLIYAPSETMSKPRVGKPVSLRDLPATVLDLTGVDGGGKLPGESLALAWRDADAFEERSDIVLIEALVIEGRKQRGEMKSLVAGKYCYVRNGDGSEELYDLFADIEQEKDLTLSASGREAAKKYRQAVDEIVKSK